jgi:hypothetical protein
MSGTPGRLEEETTRRVAAFSAQAAVCLFSNGHSECWRGTRAQLESRGVHLDGPWPLEPGGKRWAFASGPGGSKVVLTALLRAGLYEVYSDKPIDDGIRILREAAVGGAGPVARPQWRWCADGSRERVTCSPCTPAQ